MQLSETSKLYDENYFAHGCGREYKRDDHWLNFFDAIAGRIVASIQPKTMLDAGCAMGFLVEQMRARGVEAWGVDISEYAIQNAHESIRDYIWVGSITDPLPRKYDLIITIEVLEHLPKEASEQALVNLCQHTDDIIFSSTPLDYKESTHFNVQPVEYWAELFAQKGFFRDVDFDATFITPWAARYRRKQESIPRMARDFERWAWATRKENADLREQAISNENMIHAMSSELEKLRTTLNEKEKLIMGLEVQAEIWAEQQATAGWKMLQKIRDVRMRLAPPNSGRARLVQAGINGVKMLVQEGPIQFGRKALSKLSDRPPPVKQVPVDNITAYKQWLKENTPNARTLSQQREQAKTFAYRPLISVITPVYNPPPNVLRAALESVLAQTYDHWELCLVNGNALNGEVSRVLAKYAQKDARIHLKTLDQNLGISGNSNEAIKMAQGEFVQIFDHDDVLAPDALFEAVRCLNENKDIDVIYYDEDKLTGDDRERKAPFFKPDWSPEMLISANYLSHSLIRRSLIEKAGMFDPNMDGAQDWDLAFRVTEMTNRIIHIPKVLYHWRMISGSTSRVMDAKPGVYDAQIRCVRNHLQRTGRSQVHAILVAPGQIRSLWALSGVKVSIIIPTKDKVDFLQNCIASISQRTIYSNFEIILVDNQSVEKETLDYYKTLRGDSRIKIVEYPQPFNYSAANNLGARHASGDILLFLNNDIEVLEPDWLEEMVRWTEQPDVGIVGTKLLYPDQTIQHAGVIIGLSGHANHVFQGAKEKSAGPYGSVEWYRNYSAITGACMMMRREVFESLGGFDEQYILAFSDIEMCIRVRQRGLRIVYTPFARLKHFEGKTRGSYIPSQDVRIGLEHFLTLVETGDPYFNPNLSYSHIQPTIALKGEENRVERLKRLGEHYARQDAQEE